MVVTADNDLYVDEFFELCKKYECKPMLRALSLSGQAEKNKELLTKQQLGKQRANTYKGKEKEKPLKKDFYACSCDAGATTLTIISLGGNALYETDCSSNRFRNRFKYRK